MQESFFVQLNAEKMAELINNATSSVCYAAPGIQSKPAQALIALGEKIGIELITVFLDVDEKVIRMGYGELSAVNELRQAGIRVQHISGLRNGLLVVDGTGYSYTPTALLLENDSSSSVVLNAMRLTSAQVSEALTHLSPASKAIALAQATTPEEKEFIQATASEILPEPVVSGKISDIELRLKSAPPTKFDVARQVRVFQPYFQYVELRLTGAAIQKHKLNIPESIQNTGDDKELQGRLKTTFDLIDKNANISSKSLDDELRDIRNQLTRSLGQQHGRIIVKTAKPRLQERLAELEIKIQEHQEIVRKELDAVLEKSKQMIVSYFLPTIIENPPDALIGIFGQPTDEQAQIWLENSLAKSFPDPEKLIKNIRLEVSYKDVTYETLNKEDFLDSIQKAYPELDWNKAYDEFIAAGEAN